MTKSHIGSTLDSFLEQNSAGACRRPGEQQGATRYAPARGPRGRSHVEAGFGLTPSPAHLRVASERAKGVTPLTLRALGMTARSE